MIILDVSSTSIQYRFYLNRPERLESPHALGRTLKTIANYVDGTVCKSDIRLSIAF